MTLFLDNERLNGPHVARISARPRRVALPLAVGGPRSLEDAVELECQLWGGAANIILPITSSGHIPDLYRRILPGSQIDDVHGSGYDPEMALNDKINLTETRSVDRAQLAAGLLPFRATKNKVTHEVVTLDTEDPWHGIYLTCLGKLPEKVDPNIVQAGQWLPDIDFSDFVDIRRVTATGSLSDLRARLWPEEHVLTPRQLSMHNLSYAATASTSIRLDRPVLPQPWFARYDAGPNILVVCSPGSLEDLALLWNLRAAHGDFYATPIGIPHAEFSADALTRLTSSPGIALNGMAATVLYVTSCSVTTDELSEALTGLRHVSVRPPEEMLMFGSVLGLSRDEVLIWKEGQAAYMSLDSARHQEVLHQRNINRLLVMQYDISVEDAPLPFSDDYRVDHYNGAFYNGAHTRWSSLSHGDKISTIEWPSRELVASSLASIRNLKLRESAPGIAARIMVEMLGGLSDASLLCHAPLLELLESMAARQGFNWYKERLRQAGIQANPGESVGSSIDELPEKSFHDFKRALSNSEVATKYWLAWAERSSVVIKGFPLQCPKCGAKQWIPIGNFKPPVTCRGCAKAIEFPFGDRHTIDFKYRLSEQARRVYEVDAMGHILVARFFEMLFGRATQSDLIGMHPGMSVFPADGNREIGEADLLMLTRRGEFIPIEVKRTASGLTEREVSKLDILASALESSWSGVAACQYSQDTGDLMDSLVVRNADGTHRRVALTYDLMLDPQPTWALGGDPFALTTLTAEEIAARDKKFVAFLTTRAKESDTDWLAYSMLRRREQT
ncbi:hypothetical protein LN996_02445 [Arthrobacter sp. AK01]|uniref:hypothetical protein n=1 Tax=Arthrobacter sp. AK01 TaxID=2894084 RepID=UPI001E28733D|nr:hypothetical protein [Arthrobacter sp. AK01]MCD4849665.1 hypothetical protein [Arthrobacter sp. AK01]